MKEILQNLYMSPSIKRTNTICDDKIDNLLYSYSICCKKNKKEVCEFFENIVLNTFMFHYYCLYHGLQLIDIKCEDVKKTNIDYMFFKIGPSKFLKMKTFGYIIKYTNFDHYTYCDDEQLIVHNCEERYYLGFLYFLRILHVKYFIKSSIFDEIMNDINYSLDDDEFTIFEPSTVNLLRTKVPKYFEKHIVDKPSNYIVYDYTDILNTEN